MSTRLRRLILDPNFDFAKYIQRFRYGQGSNAIQNSSDLKQEVEGMEKYLLELKSDRSISQNL